MEKRNKEELEQNCTCKLPIIDETLTLEEKKLIIAYRAAEAQAKKQAVQELLSKD